MKAYSHLHRVFVAEGGTRYLAWVIHASLSTFRVPVNIWEIIGFKKRREEEEEDDCSRE